MGAGASLNMTRVFATPAGLVNLPPRVAVVETMPPLVFAKFVCVSRSDDRAARLCLLADPVRAAKGRSARIGDVLVVARIHIVDLQRAKTAKNHAREIPRQIGRAHV